MKVFNPILSGFHADPSIVNANGECYIANSTFENWRRANPDKPMEEFDFQLNKMSVSGALFDMIKLLDIGKTVISKMTAEEVYENSLNIL